MWSWEKLVLSLDLKNGSQCECTALSLAKTCHVNAPLMRSVTQFQKQNKNTWCNLKPIGDKHATSDVKIKDLLKLFTSMCEHEVNDHIKGII